MCMGVGRGEEERVCVGGRKEKLERERERAGGRGIVKSASLVPPPTITPK